MAANEKGEPSCSKVGNALCAAEVTDDNTSDIYGKDEGIESVEDDIIEMPAYDGRYEPAAHRNENNDDDPFGLYVLSILSLCCCCCSLIGCCMYGSDRLGRRQKRAWRIMICCALLGVAGWMTYLILGDPVDHWDELSCGDCPGWCDSGSKRYDTSSSKCVCTSRGETEDCFLSST